MKKNALFIFLILNIISVFSQKKHTLKIESSLSLSNTRLIDVEPGPNWKGYSLNGQNLFNINVINGIKINEKVFYGFGLGYLNFEGINGATAFADLNYQFYKGKFSPFSNLKVGYNHIWNQYKNGTGSAFFELNFGFSHAINKKSKLYLASGILFTHQSFIIPLRLGIEI